MNAIIRHLNSGEHFRAELDDAGDVLRMSSTLPMGEAAIRDADTHATGEYDYSIFEDADMETWGDDDRDSAKAWTSDKIAVVHTFD